MFLVPAFILISILTLDSTTAADYDPCCWTDWGENAYKYFNYPVDASTAENICIREGGHLASIHSDAENDFLSSFDPQLTPFAWIGLMQAHYPGSRAWTWTDGSPVDYTRWDYKQPDNWYGREHCTQVFRTGRPRSWNDAECSLKLNGFICKRPK